MNITSLLSKAGTLALTLLLLSPAAAFAAPAAAAPPLAQDGYDLTASVFDSFKKKGVELETELRTLLAAAATGDAAKQKEGFLKRLTEKYPGAAFDGKQGTIPYREHFTAAFTAAPAVQSITVTGTFTLTYYLAEDKISITQGENSISILLDLKNPERSLYVNTAIPSLKEEAAAIVQIPGKTWLAADTPESAILNDAYNLMSVTQNTRMDVFAIQVASSDAMRKKILSVAANGYNERHRSEYRQGADPKLKPVKKAAAPDKPADARFANTVKKLAALGLIIALMVWGMLRWIRSKRTPSSFLVGKKFRKTTKDSLSAMVMKVLAATGQSLWGKKRLPWSGNYHVSRRKGGWRLCDAKTDPATIIDVRYRNTYFKVIISRLDGADVNLTKYCHDFSKRSLEQALEALTQKVEEPGPEQEESAGTE